MKQYKLLKDISFPYDFCKAGTLSLFENGYFVFPYEGKQRGNNGWLGSAFMIYSTDEELNIPEWFQLIEDKEDNYWDKVFGEYSQQQYLNLEEVKYFFIPFLNWLKKNYPQATKQQPPTVKEEEPNSFTIVFSMFHTWERNIELLESAMLKMGKKPNYNRKPSVNEIKNHLTDEEYKQKFGSQHNQTDIPTLDRQDKKERIEISGLGSRWNNKVEEYYFTSNQFIGCEKWKLIKQAIEQVLNEDNDKFWEKIKAMTDEAFEKTIHHKYTEEDLKKAFESAKEVFTDKEIGRIEFNSGGWSKKYLPKYLSFEHYLTSLNKQ